MKHRILHRGSPVFYPKEEDMPWGEGNPPTWEWPVFSITAPKVETFPAEHVIYFEDILPHPVTERTTVKVKVQFNVEYRGVAGDLYGYGVAEWFLPEVKGG
jgi:hypothetical protein